MPPGHKIAVRAIAAGAPVRRYNQIIGIATQDIAPGQHVHTHNLAFVDFARDYEVGRGRARPPQYVDPAGHLHGHRARRRPHRDAQLHRRADVA